MEEMAQLDAIEDELSAKLERDQRSLQVLVITTGGMREFVFYTRDPQDAQASIEALQSHITTHELQFYIESDGQWGLFKEFS
jgi:hypothetical protein